MITFKELLENGFWIGIEKQMRNSIPFNSLPLYDKVYRFLLDLPPIKNRKKIEIVVQQSIDGELEVLLKRNNLYTYGSYEDWQEWLGFYVSDETISRFGSPTVIACCLLSMTENGLTYEEVLSANAKLFQLLNKE